MFLKKILLESIPCNDIDVSLINVVIGARLDDNFLFGKVVRNHNMLCNHAMSDILNNIYNITGTGT